MEWRQCKLLRVTDMVQVLFYKEFIGLAEWCRQGEAMPTYYGLGRMWRPGKGKDKSNYFDENQTSSFSPSLTGIEFRGIQIEFLKKLNILVRTEPSFTATEMAIKLGCFIRLNFGLELNSLCATIHCLSTYRRMHQLAYFCFSFEYSLK